VRQISERELDHRATQSTADRILREREVEEQTGLSRTTRWRLIKAGQFPQPLRLTSTAVGWKQSSITEWIASRESAASTQ
jgi:prophage regulatory protein